MLNILLKKDFQATSRCFIPLIIGFLLLSILCKTLFEIGFKSIDSNQHTLMTYIMIIFMSLYVIYIIGYYIMTYVFIISDFYKTMVSEQGYLTHTLPVSTRTILFSKLITSAVWQSITFLLTCLSIALFFIGHISYSELTDFLIEFEINLGISWQTYVFYIVVAMIISIISGPLMFYVSIAIGHLFGKYRIIGAIATYLGLYTILQILSTIILVAVGFFAYAEHNLSRIFSSTMLYSLILSIVTTLIFYLITEFIFKRKLNLE